MRLYKRNGIYQADIRMNNQRLRISTKTKDKEAAKVFLADYLGKLDTNKDDLIRPMLRLRDIVDQYERARERYDNEQDHYTLHFDILNHIKSFDLSNYLKYDQWIQSHYLSPSTKNKKRLVLSKLVRFAIDKLGLDVPQYQFKYVKQTSPKHYIYSDEEVTHLMDYFVKRGLTNMADLILTLRYTGARLSEILNLTNDCYSDEFIHLYQTKNGKSRAIPIHAKLKTREHRTFEGLHKWRCGQLFRQARKALNLPKEANIHALRHTFATRLCEAGCSIDVVSKLLGHSSIDVTMIYAKTSDIRLKSAINLIV